MLVVLVIESNQSQLQPGLTSAQTSDLCPRPFSSGLDWTPYRIRPGLDSLRPRVLNMGFLNLQNLPFSLATEQSLCQKTPPSLLVQK